MIKFKFCIVVLFAIIAITGCKEDPIYEIGEKSDQAFIQDIAVMDENHVNMVVTKVVPKITKDPVTDLESLPLVNPEILVTVKSTADLTRLYVTCTLSSQSLYATVSPAMGKIVDLSQPKVYTITSQSKKNKVLYTIKVTKQ